MKPAQLTRRALVAAATLSLLLGGTAAVAAEKVRLAINLSPISALPLIAQNKGFFAKNGLEVTISNFSSGRQALETVLGGGADIATAAESPVTAATFANQKVALLARMEYSELKTLVAVPGINKPSDLKGKRIGYASGTGSEVFTHELLKKAGLTKNDVTLVNLRPQDMAAAAASGSIDAYNIWEPHVANGRKALGAKATLLDVRDVYSETFNVVTTADYAQKNPKISVAFLRSLLEAEKWLKANPDEAITLVGSLTNLKKDELAEVWNDYIFELVLDQRTVNALKNHAQWRIDSGNAAGGATTLPDFGKVLQSGPLKEVAPDRVKI
jgi:ABC-type nitrate/sulfonate/bicarbonate transport system substrate-binding protein